MVLQVSESKTYSRREANRTKELLSRHIKLLRPSAEALHRQTERTFGSGTPGVLYLQQREFAVLPLNDERGPLIVGTGEATTCHIIVLLSRQLRILAFAHFDGSGMKAFFEDVLFLMRSLGDDLSAGIEAHLVGGFLDPHRESQRLSCELLCFMAHADVVFHLRTAAISELNSEFRSDFQAHFPRRYGLAVDIAASRSSDKLHLVPANFEAFGPYPELRRARFCSCEDRMSNVYNAAEATLQLNPFDYNLPHDLHRIVDMPDDVLRRFSTSPQQERPGFEERLRNTYRFMLQHRKPRLDIFRGNQPLSFRLVNGFWQLIDS